MEILMNDGAACRFDFSRTSTSTSTSTSMTEVEPTYADAPSACGGVCIATFIFSAV